MSSQVSHNHNHQHTPHHQYIYIYIYTWHLSLDFQLLCPFYSLSQLHHVTVPTPLQVITTRAWEGGLKEHRPKQKWLHETHARLIPSLTETAPIYTMCEALEGYWTWSGGCDQSIGSTIPDAIVHSWLWSAATRSSSSPLGYFSNYCK